jgi:hypothetical protein
MTNALASQIVPEREKRMQREAPGVAASLLEGLDELLTVSRLGLPLELRRALACTNAIENMQGTIRRVTRNVKRWRDASMALRWVAAGMMEAQAGFRRLKAISPANCRLSDGPSPTTPDILPRTRDSSQGYPSPSAVRTSGSHLQPAGRQLPASGQFATCLRFGNRTSSINAESIDDLLAMAVGPHLNAG